MQYVKEGKNAVGSNTPGAASSAADFLPPRRSKIELRRGPGGMFEGFGVSGAVLVRPRRAWNAFWGAS